MMFGRKYVVGFFSLAFVASCSSAIRYDKISGEVANGFLSEGCHDQGWIKLCRVSERAQLYLNDQPTRLLDGYYVDSDTAFRLSEGVRYTTVQLGRPGVTEDDFHVSDSLIFTKFNGRNTLVLYKLRGEMSCSSTPLSYEVILDLSEETLRYRLAAAYSSDGNSYVIAYPLEIAQKDVYETSYNDLQALVGAVPPPESQFCSLAGL